MSMKPPKATKPIPDFSSLTREQYAAWRRRFVRMPSNVKSIRDLVLEPMPDKTVPAIAFIKIGYGHFVLLGANGYIYQNFVKGGVAYDNGANWFDKKLIGALVKFGVITKAMAAEHHRLASEYDRKQEAKRLARDRIKHYFETKLPIPKNIQREINAALTKAEQAEYRSWLK